MTTARDTPTDLPAAAPRALEVEQNGLNSIDVAERRGRPRELFWPWFAANISVLGISYGAFLLGFGVSFPQAVVVGVVGIIISFLLCGLVSLSGKRGHAPTMTLSRAAFGVNGNRLPSAISWLLLVGWETVLASLAVLATATVFTRLGWSGGFLTKIAALVLVAALILIGGILGFEFIMKLQMWITVITAVLDRGLRHPRCLQHRRRDACRVTGRPSSAADRCFRLHDHWLRPWLGQRRGGLLPLLAAADIERRRSRMDHLRRVTRSSAALDHRADARWFI